MGSIFNSFPGAVSNSAADRNIPDPPVLRGKDRAAAGNAKERQPHDEGELIRLRDAGQLHLSQVAHHHVIDDVQRGTHEV